MDGHVSTETHGDLRIPHFKKLYIYIYPIVCLVIWKIFGHLASLLIITLWWTYKKQWKITIFNGKIHYFYGHVPLLFVCSPEGKSPLITMNHELITIKSPFSYGFRNLHTFHQDRKKPPRQTVEGLHHRFEAVGTGDGRCQCNLGWKGPFCSARTGGDPASWSCLVFFMEKIRNLLWLIMVNG